MNVAEPVGRQWKRHVEIGTEFRHVQRRRGALCATRSERCATNGGFWYEVKAELSPQTRRARFLVPAVEDPRDGVEDLHDPLGALVAGDGPDEQSAHD